MKRAVVLILLLALVVPACATTPAETDKKPTAKESQTAASSGSTQVMMLGRSVMNGWFTHWTGDSSQPYNKEGFSLYYREIDGPDSIMDSVQSRVEEDGGGAGIVFFKLCFVDFNGDDRDSARSNLKRNQAYAQKAYDVMVARAGKKLVIGNALPQVKGATTYDLVWNHREYNKWLNDFAAAHSGQVWIFDQYGILADGSGYLKSGYETSADDSHPNDAGYSAMDGPFFDLLKSVR
ncbi:MAG: hypothetical protein WC891_02565 [Actinomycetota bacterium]